MIKIEKELSKRYGEKIEVFPIWQGDYKDIYKFSLKNRALVVAVNKKKSMSRSYRTVLSNALQQWLFLKGLNVPEVYDFFEVGELLFAVHSYIDGKTYSDFKEHQLYLIGRIVAQLHSLTYQNRPYVKVSKKAYFFCGAIELLSRALRNVKNLITDKFYRTLPVGICHLDLTANNFLFNEEDVWLIDFDKQKRQPYAYEIYRFLKNDISRINRTLFIKGYESVRVLNNKEKNYLAFKGIEF
ncbi:MAG: phosphotransferase [Alphaproteobacteria bacterium]|nr:phosphotransferase [Alphaproteobacteria bacterium]